MDEGEVWNKLGLMTSIKNRQGVLPGESMNDAGGGKEPCQRRAAQAKFAPEFEERELEILEILFPQEGRGWIKVWDGAWEKRDRGRPGSSCNLDEVANDDGAGRTDKESDTQ